MLNIALRFITVAFVAIALMACGKTNSEQSAATPEQCLQKCVDEGSSCKFHDMASEQECKLSVDRCQQSCLTK